MTRDKLITATVVFFGIIALSASVKLGAQAEWVGAGGTVLLLIAGSLRSMILSEKTEPKS